MALTIATNKNWSDYEANSTTALVIGSGALTALTLTIETGKGYTAGDDINLVPTQAKIPMALSGTVTSYNSLTGELIASINRIESQISSWDLVSATSNTIGVGSKTFVTYNGKNALLAAADPIMIGRISTQGGNRMVGTVSSYNNADGTLVFNCATFAGSGSSITDWIIVSAGTFNVWKVVPATMTTFSLLGASTFTIDMEPSYPVGSFQSLDRGRYHVNNPSTTTPWVIDFATKNTNSSKLFDLFTSGAFDVTGARILVKTGDGTAGQTINYNTPPLEKIDWPAIEVELSSGAGIYRPFYVTLDNATPRGFSGRCLNRGYSASFLDYTTGTITLTTATPTVISWPGNQLNPGDKFRHTTAGSITGMTVGTDYYVLPDAFVAGTSFKISLSPLGSPVAVTAQSGIHTGYGIPAVASGDHGNIALFNPSTRILKFGDGVRGNVIPNGAKVRIPNIYFQMDHPRTPLLTAYSSAASGTGVALTVGKVGALVTGTASSYVINGEEITATSSGNTIVTVARALNGTAAQSHAQGDTVYTSYNSSANRAATDATDGGKCTWNCCAFGLGVYAFIGNPQTANFTDVWAVGAFRVNSATSDVFVDGLFSSPHPCGDGTVTIDSILGETSVNRIYAATTASGTNSGATAVSLASLQNVAKAENLEGFVLARNGTANTTGVQVSACVTNAFLRNITCIGARLYIQNCSRIEVDGIRHSAESNARASTQVSLNAIILANVQFGVYRNISTVPGGVGPRSQFISTDSNCSDNTFHTLSMDASSNAQAIITPSGNANRVARGTFGVFPDRGSTTSGTGALTNTATGDTCIIRDCQFTPGDSYGADNGNGSTVRVFLEQTTGHSMFWRNSPSTFNGNYQETGPFHVLLDPGTKASGNLFAQFSVKANRDIYDLNGDAYIDNGGTVVLPTAGDYIILKSYQILRTITGFTGVSVQDVNNANLVYEFELVSHEGVFTGTFLPLTSTDLNASIAAIIGYSDAKGFKIRLKITATATNTTNKVINVRMLTTNNAATLLPIGSTNYTLTGIVAGTTVAAFQGTEEVAYVASASGTVTISLPYEFDGLMASVTMKIRKQNYSWDGHIATYNQYAFSRASLQVFDDRVVETDPAVLDLYTDLNNTTKIYDYVKYWGTKRENLLVPQLCTNVNGNLDFGSYDLVFDATASELLSVTGNTITFKTTELVYSEITTTGTADFINGSINKTVVTSVDGTSAVISLFYGDLDGYKIYLEDDMGVEQDYQTISGDVYVFYLPPPASGNWRWRAVRYGMLPETGLLDVSNGGILEFTLEGNYDTSIVENNLATVLAYTTLETLDKQYDYCQAFLTTSAGKALGRIVSKSGSSLDFGSYSVTYNATASSVFTQVASLLTIKAPTVNGSGTIATTGTILFVNGCITYISYYDSTGPHLIGIGTVSGFVPNTRIIVHNVTKGLTKHDALTTGTLSFVYENGTDYSVGDTVNIYHAYYGGTTAMKKEMVSTTVSVSGWSTVIAQTVCEVYAAYYNTYNTDGATVYATGDFVKDGTNLQIDLNDGDNLWYAHRLFLWDKYQIWFNAGNRSFFTQVVAPDAGNISIGTLMLDNLNSTTAYQGDVINITNSTSTLPVVNPTTGGGGITMYSGGKVLTTSSGDVAPSEAQIKAWVRAELATEMARLDATITSRNAIAPDNSSISLIKNKVDQITITGGNVNSVIDATLLAKEATAKKIKGMVSTII